MQNKSMIVLLFCYFSVESIQQKQFKEKGFILAHDSRMQSTIAKKSCWQKFEAAGHSESTVKKQEVMSIHS